MTAKRIDITLEQGATFVKKFNWYGGGKVVREIESVNTGCPTTITISAHGLPSSGSIPVYIDDVRGARSMNTKGKEVLATYVDANSFTVDLSTIGESYASGTGCVHWIVPKSLAGWIARMDIRGDIGDTTTLVSLTSAGGDIIIDVATAEIQITIADEITAALDFDEGVYDLELEDASGDVTRLIEGIVAFNKEVTRP